MTRWNGQVLSGPQGGVTVIWTSPSHITLAIWVSVRGYRGCPYHLGVWEWGRPNHCDSGAKGKRKG